ncbi:MAG: 3'-5' exonuclease, partial [Chloroflexota bacterium]
MRWHAKGSAVPQLATGLEGEGSPALVTRRRLLDALSVAQDPEVPLAQWLRAFDAALGLSRLLERAVGFGDDLELAALTELICRAEPGGPLASHRFVDFAADGRVVGKVVLTTLHSAKGRELDAVILPGLVEGVLPPRAYTRSAAAQTLAEARRLFYVGFTRARR